MQLLLTDLVPTQNPVSAEGSAATDGNVRLVLHTVVGKQKCQAGFCIRLDVRA